MKHTDYIRTVLWGAFLLIPAITEATVIKQSMSFIKEESLNGHSFKETVEIENTTQKEQFSINGKTVTPREYEEALLNAEKEESKKERRRNQEERLKLYETNYKGQVKIAQADLKKYSGPLSEELARLSNERLKPFIVFSPQTIASQEQLSFIKDTLLPEAQKLAHSNPEVLDIKKVQTMRNEVQGALTAVKEMFIMTVNNGINKADDTKLLKELLALL